jgi:hypothetical protein
MLVDLLTENLPSGGPDMTLVGVTAESASGRRELRVEDRSDRRFSSLARMTAFPTTALCDMVASGAIDFRGAAAMHSVAESGGLNVELDPLGIAPIEV